jgi:hypothetical protein
MYGVAAVAVTVQLVVVEEVEEVMLAQDIK